MFLLGFFPTIKLLATSVADIQVGDIGLKINRDVIKARLHTEPGHYFITTWCRLVSYRYDDQVHPSPAC